MTRISRKALLLKKKGWTVIMQGELKGMWKKPGSDFVFEWADTPDYSRKSRFDPPGYGD